MNDREYIKLNTSIQTASNAATIKELPDGTIPAVIELRLPDNLYDTRTGNKKVDTVTMLTTKLRLSMLETPIAQIPLDQELSAAEHSNISTCQLDVYPYSYNANSLLPDPNDDNVDLSLPEYKKHKIEYQIILSDFTDPLSPVYTTKETYNTQANTEGYGFPTSSIYYEIANKSGSLKIENHLMNLTIQPNTTNYFVENGNIYIKSIGILEQMFQNALENAITYALTEDNEIIQIYLIDSDHIPDSLDPKPNSQLSIIVDGITYYYWKTVRDESSTVDCKLYSALKPCVRFNDKSLSISYDTASFGNIIPIIWNSGYVDTYDTPEQMTLDTFRKLVWSKPPPKRMYKYGAYIDDTTAVYNYTALESLKCLMMNIIGNQAMKETFSFLPWITVDTTDMPDFKYHGEIVTYNVKVENTYSNATAQMSMGYQPPSAQTSLRMRYTAFRPNSTMTFNPESQYAFIDWSQVLTAGKSYAIFIYQLAPNTADTPSNRLQKRFYCGKYKNQDNLPTKTVLQNYWWTDEPTTPSDDVTVSEYTTTSPQTVGSEIIEATPVSNSTITVEGTETIYENLEAYNLDDDVWILAKNQGTDEWDATTTSVTIDGVSDLPTRTSTYIPDSPADIFQQVGTIDVPDPDDPDQATTIPYAVWLRAWEIKTTSVNTPIRFKYNWQGTFNNVRIDRKNETQTTVQTTTIESVIPPSENGTAAKIIPNLKMDNNKFYILDGTNAMVNIGSQELVETNEDAYLYTVENTFAYDSINIVNQQSYYYASTPSSLNEETHTITPATIDMDMWEYKPVENPSGFPPGKYLCYYCVSSISLTDENWDTDWENRTSQSILTLSGAQLIYTTDSLIADHTSFSYTTTPQTTPEDVVTTTYSNDPSLVPGTTTNTSTVSVFTGVTNTEQPGRRMITPYWYLETGWEPARVMYGRGEWVTGGGAITEPVYPLGGIWYRCPFVLDCLPQDIPPQWVHSYYDDVRHNYRVFMYWRMPDNPSVTFKRLHVSSPLPQYPTIGDIIPSYQEIVSREDTTTTSTTVITAHNKTYVGNVRLTFTWDNLPIVLLSPIQSFVLVLNGMKVSQEIHPINIAQPGGSSLVSTIPIIENYYSFATTLRDLHDELVVTRETFADSAFYSLDTKSGQERSLTMAVKYITKDGRLHQVNIPKNGVYTLQLTFGISYYLA